MGPCSREGTACVWPQGSLLGAWPRQGWPCVAPSASCSPSFRPVADISGSGPSGWGGKVPGPVRLPAPGGQFLGGLCLEAPLVVRNVPLCEGRAAFGPDDLHSPWTICCPGLTLGEGQSMPVHTCLCTCMSMHLCVCTCVHVCPRASLCVHSCVSVHTCVFVCISVCLHVHVYMRPCVSGCVHVCVHVYLPVSARVSVCICVCISTCLWDVPGACVHMCVCGSRCACMCLCVWVCVPANVGLCTGLSGPGRRLRSDGGAAGGIGCV